MSLLDKWQRAGDRIDGFAGRIIYRIFGIVAAVIALAALWAAWDLISTGKSLLGGLLLGIPGLLCLWLAKWCFSPSRNCRRWSFRALRLPPGTQGFIMEFQAEILAGGDDETNYAFTPTNIVAGRGDAAGPDRKAGASDLFQSAHAR
ncbi:MAG: hypothetical protein AB3N20_12735 [Rhizobiaceae bacterium]